MEKKEDQPATVDAYIALFPPDIQHILNQLRAVIREAAPDAEERIGYGMPGYYLGGPLAYFAAHQSHIGFYPLPEGIAGFNEKLATYKQSKGAVQFPLDKPMPYELVREIVQWRAGENRKNIALKKSAGKARPKKA